MAQMTVRINGYAYTVGCEDGQEAHLKAMAGDVDQRIESIKTAVGQQSGESQLLMLASLMMADELHDLKTEFASMQKQLARVQGTQAVTDPKLGRRLGRLAKRAEEIAAGLEQA